MLGKPNKIKAFGGRALLSLFVLPSQVGMGLENKKNIFLFYFIASTKHQESVEH